MNDAFLYLWYIHATKKFYLGKTNGKDSYYTHSSTSSEEFRSIVPPSNRPISERKEFLENIPKGISRKKIAHGTDEEMCILENKLLINRKNRCWNRYYNESLGDPRYVDQSGENNPSYTNGMSVGRKSKDPEIRKAAEKKREAWPERKAYKKEYDAKRMLTPEYKIWKKNYYARPDVKAWKKNYDAERYASNKTWGQQQIARRKAERQGEGTLDAFL